MELNLEKLAEALTSEARAALPKGTFGLPEEGKYPLEDAGHVRSAISYFHKCPEEKRSALASRIKARAKELGVTIGPDALVNKY